MIVCADELSMEKMVHLNYLKSDVRLYIFLLLYSYLYVYMYNCIYMVETVFRLFTLLN